MNWIGGARQRVSLQGEKKLQKEFFERQKLKKHNLHDSANGRNRSKNQPISQDIAALQTINRFSPIFSHLGVDDGQVKKVDLKGYKSTVVKENRVPVPVQEVELPHSPITIPSSLHLTDSTSIKAENPKWEDIFKEKTKKHEPKSLFSYHVKQNEVPVKKRPQTCLSEYNSTVVPRNSNKEMKVPIDDWGVSSQTVERTNQNDKDMCHLSAQVNNPWASEDFQMTPLSKYDAKYEDMIPWKINGDFNRKSFRGDTNPRAWSHEHVKPLQPSYLNKTSHNNNVPVLSPELCHSQKTHSGRLNPIKPRDTYLDENFSRKKHHALKHINPYSKLDSFDSEYSIHSSKKPRYNYNLNQTIFSNNHMKSGKCYDSYSAYEPDSESTPVNKLTHNDRTGSHRTLAEIRSEFIRKHGDMNSLLEDNHYKIPPRIGNIPVESPLFRFHPSNNHAKNQNAVRNETPICDSRPSLFNNHQSVRKSLTPLFDSTQPMAALTPNEISFVKMLSQDQKVMTSFDEESNIGLRDDRTPNFREKSKKRKSADKSKEMTEVLAELSQLQHENDKDNLENISPVPLTQKTMESPIFDANEIEAIETEICAEKQPSNKNLYQSDTPTSSGDLLDNIAPTLIDNLPEYDHAHCTTKENLSKHNRSEEGNTCKSKEDLSVHKQVSSTSTVDLSENEKTCGTTLCPSPILLPDSFEAQNVLNRSISTFEDSKRNCAVFPESFDLQIDTRKAHEHKFNHSTENINVLTQNDKTLKRFNSVPHKDSNATLALRHKDNTLQLDVHVDMTEGLESEASSAVVDPKPTTSCHLHLQSGDVPQRQQVDQATQTELATKEIALSPIFKKSKSVSVGTQWQSMECYSPEFTQGCVELCEDENNGTQLNKHCNVKDIEKFPTECLSSTQDSLIDNSDSSQSQNFYSLRSRQKCLQS